MVKSIFFILKDKITYFLYRIFVFFKYFNKKNNINAYWFHYKKNFGDFITPLLLQKYGYNPIFAQPNDAQLISTGSLFEHIPANFKGVIIGTGFIDEKSLLYPSKAKILSVRGKLSLNKINSHYKDNILLGDPGLLADKLLKVRQIKKYKLGIVPHWIDKDSMIFNRLSNNLNKDILLIDVEDDPINVIEQIDRCENIISSSLHGLIVADSLGIPTGWVLSDKVLGGKFKFYDYYSSLDVECEPINIFGNEDLDVLMNMTTLKPQNVISDLKKNIDKCFRDLVEILK